jgi:hypothetical protein
VVVGARTYELIRDVADVRSLGTPELKGKTEAVRVYELVGLRDDPDAGSLAQGEVARCLYVASPDTEGARACEPLSAHRDRPRYEEACVRHRTRAERRRSSSGASIERSRERAAVWSRHRSSLV